jgi:hypothetical protein
MKSKKIGYKLTFCKKICDLYNPVDGTKYPFRTFGHFDGFYVKPIHDIVDFENNRYMDIDEVKENGKLKNKFSHELHDKYHSEKQTINLLEPLSSDLTGSTFDIFSSKMNREQPIIVITIVNSYQNAMSVQNVAAYIMKSIHLYHAVSFSVYETFAIEDCVIVFRSNGLNSIIKALDNMRKSKDFKAINLYSIVGLAWSKLEEERMIMQSSIIKENLYASIRMYVRPSANFKKIEEKLDKWEELHDDINYISVDKSIPKYSFMTMGRYDMQVCFHFRNVFRFMSLFDELNPGQLPKEHPFRCIISTETTIMCELGVDDPNRDYFHNEKTQRDIAIQVWLNEFNKKMDDRLKEIERTYDEERFRRLQTKWIVDIQNPVYMLIERAHQLYHAASSHKYASIIHEFARNFTRNIPDFLNREDILVTTDNIQNFIFKIISNIDDLFSVSFRDFEYSQKDGMYVHASGNF